MNDIERASLLCKAENCSVRRPVMFCQSRHCVGIRCKTQVMLSPMQARHRFAAASQQLISPAPKQLSNMEKHCLVPRPS